MSRNPTTIRPFNPAFLFLNVQSVSLTDKQFEKLCRDNPDLRIELTSRGELIVMPPTSLKTGWRNSILTRRLTEWAQDNGSGLAFDSSTLFTLPDGSKRSPDASWIQRQRFENLSENEQDGFAQIAPDFVIELCSPTDRWALLQEKMLDYIHNGVRLAVLINPMSKQVLTYRPGRPVDTLDNPEEVCCEPELPGFILDVREIW
jgi:Uma2 family endonuclease